MTGNNANWGYWVNDDVDSNHNFHTGLLCYGGNIKISEIRALPSKTLSKTLNIRA